MSTRLEKAIVTIEDDAAPRFILVFLLLIVLLALLLLLPESTAGRSVTTIFTGLVLMAAVWASRVKGRFVRVANAIVAVAVIVATLALVLGDQASVTPNAIVMTVFTLAMPVCIVFGLRGERTVNIQTVFGAISLYFMIGLLFAFVITVAARFGSAPYFAQGTDGSLSQRVYFSFVTLATLGYGDFTPNTGLGRMLAVFETVTGSLYLVTAVSLVVTRLGHVRGDKASST
jgi:drug/metabolite transporter (DMT)-like permease